MRLQERPMTERLEDALRRLTPEQVEQVTRYVESVAASTDGARDHSAKPLLTWIGCMKGGPYQSGLQAQEAAKHRRIFLLERGLAK
jgi:hypothetical protein